MASVVEEFSGLFQLEERRRVTTVATLDEKAVADLLLTIYRPFRREAPRAMQVTFSLDLLLFLPKPEAARTVTFGL